MHTQDAKRREMPDLVFPDPLAIVLDDQNQLVRIYIKSDRHLARLGMAGNVGQGFLEYPENGC